MTITIVAIWATCQANDNKLTFFFNLKPILYAQGKIEKKMKVHPPNGCVN